MSINVWYAVPGWNNHHFRAYYMLKMYQHVMLGETNAKVFADVSFKEGLAQVSSQCCSFGMYPKPIQT
jgi:NADH-quinone oxidoreductase subunit M